MTLSVGVVPKSTRNPYFEDCHLGAQEAADELGFTLRWEGPPNADVERQVQIVEEWTITSTLSAPNQNAWISEFKARLAKEYPALRLVDVCACDDALDKARRETLYILEKYPEIDAIVGFCSPAVPGAAEALKGARRKDVRVTGVSLPSLCRNYIEEGVVESVIMWKTRNLGYLVAASAQAVATGALARGAVSFRAGRLGTVVVLDDQIRLGRCHIVTKGNIAQFE